MSIHGVGILGSWTKKRLQKMNKRFETFVAKVIDLEAGFTDDPDDHGNWTGGKIGSGTLKGTKFGISAASYPGCNIENLTRRDAIEIYYKDFWKRARCEDLPDHMQLIHFDASVNHGVTGAIRLLQKAIGDIAVDGDFGPQTMAGLSRATDTDLIAQRALFYAKIVRRDPRKLKYLVGWNNRLVEIAKAAT